MAKLLRVLIIVILILSIVSLVFAHLQFGRKELLTKRNAVLTEQIVSLSKTIEKVDAPEAETPEIQKDISEVSDRELANPERESVLERYSARLEQQNLEPLNYDSDAKRIQLNSYYVVDAEGKKVISPVDGRPQTKGPGSMQELLDQLLERAKLQQGTLNKTRDELTKMRERVAAAVADINKLKTEGRVTKRELKESREQVAALQTEKEALEGRVAKLTAEKKELTAEVADKQDQIEKLNEEKITITDELASSQKTNAELLKKIKDLTSGNVGGPTNLDPTNLARPSAGDKGKVIEANDELKFVIIELSGDAMDELMGAERANALPQFDMNVRRTGRASAAGDFVTRIKLRQAVRGKNFVVADILSDWQQVPVEKGDVVFF